MFLSEHRVRDETGEWRWMRARGRAVGHDADGRIRRIAGTARDVTAIRAKESERRIATEVMHSMAEAVVVVDDAFHFVTVNPAFTRMSGYAPEDVVGKDAALLNSGQHDLAFYDQSRQAMQQGQWIGEMWQRRKDGQEILCAVQANATAGRLATAPGRAGGTDHRPPPIDQGLLFLAKSGHLTTCQPHLLRSGGGARRARKAPGHLRGVAFLTWTVRDVNARWATHRRPNPALAAQRLRRHGAAHRWRGRRRLVTWF